MVTIDDEEDIWLTKEAFVMIKISVAGYRRPKDYCSSVLLQPQPNSVIDSRKQLKGNIDTGENLGEYKYPYLLAVMR